MSVQPPALCRALIAAAAALVPADRRADWTREWRTEAACARLPSSRLALRCLGAFVHAAWLRWDRWRSEMLTQDLKHALRALGRRPLYVAITVLTLALGIGANAAMFGAVQAVLLRPLPFPEPERLVEVFTTTLTSQARIHGSNSPSDFADWREDSRSFDALAAFASDSFALTGDVAAEQLPGAAVTGRFFDVLDVPALVGRRLGASDETVGEAEVVVLSHALWMRRFGGDEHVVGRTVMIDGTPRQVVGVMPGGFAYPLDSELWLPLRFSPDELATQRGAHYLAVVGRLARTATLDSARAEVSGLAARLARDHPKTNWNQAAQVDPLHEAVVGHVRGPLLVLMGAVGFVLLIVCVNVAGLALAQSVGRGRDLAIRRTLGAGRARLIAGTLAESALLGLVGGAGGLLLAFGATRAMAVWAEELQIPLLDQARVDPSIVLFTTVLSLAAAAAFGALPAWRAGAGRDLAGRMRVDGPQVTGGLRGPRSLLVVTQTALAVVLLVGAGLLARSFAHLRSVDLGFETTQRLTFSVSLPDARYAEPSRRAAFYDELLARVRRQAGVESAGAVFGLPMSSFAYNISTYELDGRRLDEREESRLTVHLRAASADYFRTMGMPVVRGRAFEPRDVIGARPVVIVSESAARLLWPDADPLGRRIVLGTTLGMGEGKRVGGEVVGVVPDVRHKGPGQDASPTLYLAQAQVPVGFATVVVRASSDPSALAASLRTELAALDRDLPMFQVRTLDQLAAHVVAQPRLYMILLAVFAATAVLLAALGLYGVLAQAVGQRTREIGIRMAVGAARREVIVLILSQGGRLGLAGVVLGLLGAALASRALSGLLFGVRPLDLPTYGAVGLALLGIALFASWLPARRASRVDPVRALRAD